MSGLRVAVIGCGRIGARHARTVRGLAGLAAELWCCDPVPDAARAVAGELGARVLASVEEVIAAAPDAVVVATPTATHAAITGALLRAGVPTFCEKPLAMTLEETARVGRLADAHGTLLQVGFHRRFDPGYAAVRRAVRGGALGTLRLVRAGTHEAPERAVPVAESGSVLRDVLIHDFDAVRHVTGAEVVAVTSAGVEGRAGVGDGRDWPAAACLLELDDGALAVVTGGRPNPPGYDARLEAYGSGGSAAAGLDARTPTYPRTPGSPPPYESYADRFAEAYRDEIAGFLAAARGEGENRCPWAEAHAALRIAVAGERSLEERRRVELREVR